MAKTQRDLQQYSITSTVIPTSAGDTLRAARKPADTTAAALNAIVALVQALKAPYTLVVPYTTYGKGAPTQPLLRALLKAYDVTGVEGAPRRASAAAPTTTPPTALRTPGPANP
jgi:hypothetical protein